MATDDDDLLDCFLNLPQMGTVPLPLSFQSCATAQAQDAALQQLVVDDPQHCARQQLAVGVDVVVCTKDANSPWKICIPTAELDNTVRWHHACPSHPGVQRLKDTIALHFAHPDLQQRCECIIR